MSERKNEHRIENITHEKKKLLKNNPSDEQEHVACIRVCIGNCVFIERRQRADDYRSCAFSYSFGAHYEH